MTSTITNPKICLNMIVRNESAIIERCLESALGHIDYYVIGDTGSTDNTVDIIKNFFDKHEIIGEIHKFPFIDFSQARNQALELAKASKGEFDYILFNDADMELRPEPEWKKNIRHPVCSIRQKNDSINYFNTRLLQRDVQAKYVGKTHEFLSTPNPSLPIEGIWLLDHANGSSRSEKSERDLRLLKESIEENPKDHRSLFYIANTLKDLRYYYDALKYYKQRIKEGGWAEEVWYSTYMSAACYLGLGKEAKFIATSLDAFEMRPWRAEPLLPLAKYYREAGKNELALMISEQGLSIPFPDNDTLFIENFVYKHAFENEISISGFYAKNEEKRAKAYSFCMALAISQEADEHIQYLALNNSRFYAKNAIDLFPSFKANKLKNVAHQKEGFVGMNPSVVQGIDNKTYCVLRTVNYWINDWGHCIAPENIFHTENYMCELDYPSFDIVKSTKIEVDVKENRTNFLVRDHEDCRPFWWKGEWWASATVRDRHPSGQCEISLFNLKGDKENVFHVSENSCLEDRNQKNWMPVVLPNEELVFIYSCDPLIILQVEEKNKKLGLKLHKEAENTFNLSRLRGSSQCVPTSKGYLFIGHEVFGGGGERQYLHRFVELDKDFNVTHVSDIFRFLTPGIEFCAGMALRTSPVEELLVSFGIKDKEAWIARIALSDVENHLKPYNSVLSHFRTE